MTYEVADHIYRLGTGLVNWYLVEAGGRLTVVDAGNPNQHGQLAPALVGIGKDLADVEAIILTHAHGDHLGSSTRISHESGAAVLVHHQDGLLARGEAEREYERHWVRDLYRLFAWKSLLSFYRGGALKAPPVLDASHFTDGETLDVPGRPRVVHTPGHTDGSCCFEMKERDTIFTGDALVTLSIVTGAVGPRVMPGSFNKNSYEALESLSHLSGIMVETVLPGHGEPWHGSLAAALTVARQAGTS